MTNVGVRNKVIIRGGLISKDYKLSFTNSPCPYTLLLQHTLRDFFSLFFMSSFMLVYNSRMSAVLFDSLLKVFLLPFFFLRG